MTYSEREQEFTFAKKVTIRNSSGDEIANVNFFYDDIVQYTHCKIQ